MADKDYCPEFSTKKFNSVKNPLLEGDLVTSARTCAALILNSSKIALDVHADLVAAYVQHLQAVSSLSDDDRLEAAFPTDMNVPDKDAETLRRAACAMHVDFQYGDADELPTGDLTTELIVNFLLHQEIRQVLAPMEAAAADGSIPTDRNLQALFRDHQEQTRELYREALAQVPAGKSPSTAHITRPRLSRKPEMDLTRVVGNLKGSIE
jgi:hypothetical protein